MTKEPLSTEVLNSIPGGPELMDWFGYVPSFHDAEIIDLHLSRTGTSILRIHTWEMDPETKTEDSPPVEKHVIVTFILEDIVSLDLEDFSPQNVISGLVLRLVREEVPSFNMKWLQPPKPLPDIYEIVLEPCYGLCGTIRAHRVAISLTPGKAQDREFR